MGRAGAAIAPPTSAGVQDGYARTPSDLPWRSSAAPRFRCDNRACPRRAFAEGVGSALRPRASRTMDVSAPLFGLVETAGDDAGARLALAAGLPVSPGTRLEPAPYATPLGPPVGANTMRPRRR